MSSCTSRQLSRVPLMMAFFHIVCLAKGMCTWFTACKHPRTDQQFERLQLLHPVTWPLAQHIQLAAEICASPACAETGRRRRDCGVSRKFYLGLGSAVCPVRPGREVPAAFHCEVVAKGDVVHGLRGLEHHMLPALKYPAQIAHTLTEFEFISDHILQQSK